MEQFHIHSTTELCNGVQMPLLGLGTFLAKEGKEVYHAVRHALDTGYRHIDTAAIYGNEESVGKAVKDSGIPREDIFITSKLWNSEQGFEPAIKAFEESLKKLQTDYLDLYLIHWPVKDKYKASWRALESLLRKGSAKAIGVSNFLQHHLEDLLTDSEMTPMVNQMEFHPRLVQQDLLDFCESNGIQYEAWAPIMKGKAGEISLLADLSDKYDKSPAQILLRWDLQKGVVTIPKSVNADRIEENADIFDFEILREDMNRINALDKNERIGPDPDNFDF